MYNVLYFLAVQQVYIDKKKQARKSRNAGLLRVQNFKRKDENTGITLYHEKIGSDNLCNDEVSDNV